MRRQAIEAVEQSRPDVAFAIFDERGDAVRDQAGECGGPLSEEYVSLLVESHPPETLARGANPDVAAWIAQEVSASPTLDLDRAAARACPPGGIR